MVKKRHIPDVSYHNPAVAELGVEVLSLGVLRQRAGAGHDLTRPQRPGFHLLMLVTSGTGTHTVDFTPYRLRPGSVLWVRPGQVQQFQPRSRVDGPLLLFQPDFPPPDVASPFGPTHWQLGARDQRLAATAAEHLAREYAALTHEPVAVAGRLLAHLLAALLHRLSLAAGGQSPAYNETFLRFREAVERHFTTTHRITDYARALGYSPRTLARATQDAVSMNPKEFLDRRIILEARRLLAHTDLPAATIGTHLGFPAATTFAKYFRHRTGTTPGDFRATTQSPT
ncbi:helix-turn-helix domain-containing protein [Saccharothrix australiensis]|uniref:AraC-like DNA-binding protein n=1 Tax=Saccharothrix australiensis TaxID=2072 RepID=A0A495W7P1_9PSEU|nr:helix-turn-helix transcriptional regulator [Saccharothrix australiensis]RKT55808.1 AraC-like DNA-binding protein [Saccharothrix australiensis]